MRIETIEKIIDNDIAVLLKQEREYQKKLNEIRIRIVTLEGVKETLRASVTENEEEVADIKNTAINSSNSINTISNIESSDGNNVKYSSKFMDDKDIKKINIFLGYSSAMSAEGNTDMSIVVAKKRFPKIEYYIYNKKSKLWNGYSDFCKDLKDWSARKGYWTNAIPKPNNREDDPRFPIMKVTKRNQVGNGKLY